MCLEVAVPIVPSQIAVVALVKSLVQKLIGRGRCLFPVEGVEGFDIKSKGFFEGLIREVKFAVQVDVLPAHGRTSRNGVGYRLALGRRGLE